jgi:hypothetical protein
MGSIPAYNTGFYHLKHFEEHLAQFLNDIQVDLDCYVAITSKFLLMLESTPVERYNLLVSMLLRYYSEKPN